MNMKKIKLNLMTKTCDGVSLKPGQLMDIRKQMQCIASELQGVHMKASATKAQCQDTVKSMKPVLIQQLQALARAAGAPTTVIQNKMSLVVAQIEALRVKVLSPGMFEYSLGNLHSSYACTPD